MFGALIVKGKARKDAVHALVKLLSERPVGSGASVANQNGNQHRQSDA